MASRKVSRLVITAVLAAAVMTAGCASEAVKTPAGPDRYKVATDARQMVEWSGAIPEDSAFKEGSNITRTEIIFAQENQGVDAEGNTRARITIEALKYSSEVKNKVIVDFDSSRSQDLQSPMAGLVGKSYTVAIAPSGAAKIIDAAEIRAAAGGTTATQRAAGRLLSDESIEERHGGLMLPEVCASVTKAGDTWKNTRTFEFSVLGTKTYERIYQVKEVTHSGGSSVAKVEMAAIPTSEKAQETHKQQQRADLSEMFDSTGTYEGRLELDLNRCRVNSCSETLSVQWTVALPSKGGANSGDVAALVMRAVRNYTIEKVD